MKYLAVIRTEREEFFEPSPVRGVISVENASNNEQNPFRDGTTGECENMPSLRDSFVFVFGFYRHIAPNGASSA